MSLKLSLFLTLPSVDNPIQTGDASYRRNCRQLGALFEKLGSGNLPNVAGGTTLDLRTSGVAASGTVTISGGSGATAAVIGGTSVSVTWATSDTNTASLLAAAINADATVNKWVTATSAAGVVTITCKCAGVLGNSVSLTASGTGVTAGAARLAGGTESRVVYSL